MTFQVKLTSIGLAKIAAAGAGGDTVNLTHMAVGDGNGNPTTPDPSQTALVREVFRVAINSLLVDANDPTIMHAEMLIPSNVGNFAVHEVGVFDEDGTLFAIANFPATWKPIAAEGSTRDMIIDVAIKVSNSSVVTLVIDTQYVGATRAWVISTITRAYILPGGTTRQVLRKIDNADGNTEWADPDDVNIIVDVIKEIQTAAADQDVFTLAVCTTDGVAVYVEGSREFEFTVLNQTQVQLVAGVAAGNRVLFVQNEPNEPFKFRRFVCSRAYYMGQFTS